MIHSVPVRSAARPLAPALLAVALLAAPVLAGSQMILPDGDVSEWVGPPQVTDPSGDAGGSGIDFTGLSIANDDTRLFLRFDTAVEVQPDEQHEITIGLDTDNDAGTGYAIGTIGADVVWGLGVRWGQIIVNGNQFPIQHADLGLFVGPTVSANEFEIAFALDAAPAGAPLFPGPVIRAAIWDDAGANGDVIDGGGAPYTIDLAPTPVPSLALTREDPGHVRIAGYNVLSDGLFSGGGRGAAFGRLLNAIDPDVWVFCEVWSHTAVETANRVETLLPSGPGESWDAVKLDSGNVIVSRFPILDSWLILPGARLTAVLVDPRPRLDSDLLIIGNHWSCCTADANRQDQADALVAFLRDARTPGGALDLADGTPIVAAGDFNLVGWRSQLDTAVTGDIADNGTFGPDSPPDWDGSDFDTVRPRHPDARLAATWWDDASSFYPGTLDWMFYTGSVLEPRNRFVLETRSMTPQSLAAAGLNAGDTQQASDHAPVVADFTAAGGPPSDAPAVGETRPGLRLDRPSPNPFSSSASVAWSLPRAAVARLAVHDVAGRIVAVLEDGAFEAGAHESRWDGRDAGGGLAAPGVYFLRLTSGGEVLGQRLVRIR